jgi:L-iditol 2-dehydrogenase
LKAIRFSATIPRYAFTLVAGRLKREAYYSGPLATTYLAEIPEPELVNENWVKVKTRYGGVCGSDLGLIFLHDTPYTEPYVTTPCTLGHENVGMLAEVGAGVEGFSVGERVVVDPMLPCAAREIEPPCEPCSRGDFSQCLRMREGSLSPGFYSCYCQQCGGSWSEFFVAHQSQLLKVPDEMSDEEALIIEPFAVALHAVMRNAPRPGQTALVYGCGIIGMLTIASLKALFPECRVIVVARYPFQAEVARGYGADEVIMQREVGDLYTTVAELTGAQVLKPMIGGRYLNGGPEFVFECVGTPETIDDAVRMTRSGGTVVMVGLVNFAKGLDWTPIWFKELTVTGSLCSSVDTFEGRTMKDFEWARELISSGSVPVEHLFTHAWRLDQFEEVISTALTKGDTGCIKQAFRF